MESGDHSNTLRADLCARIAILAQGLADTPSPLIAEEIDDIRRIAMRHGMIPALTVIHALDLALARGERGPMVAGWLDLLSVSCGCERSDAAAGEAFAAALSVRLG